jgi:hypothetical protein
MCRIQYGVLGRKRVRADNARQSPGLKRRHVLPMSHSYHREYPSADSALSELRRIPIYAMKRLQIADCDYAHMQPNNAKTQTLETRAWLNFPAPAHMATFFSERI